MPLLKKIEQNIIEALKAGDKLRVSVLRGLKSDIKYRQISLGSELKDEQVLELSTPPPREDESQSSSLGKAIATIWLIKRAWN